MRGTPWAILLLCAAFSAAAAPAKSVTPSEPDAVAAETPTSPAVRLKKGAKTPVVPTAPVNGTPAGEESSAGIGKNSRKKAPASASDTAPAQTPATADAGTVPAVSSPPVLKRSRKTEAAPTGNAVPDAGVSPADSTSPAVKRSKKTVTDTVPVIPGSGTVPVVPVGGEVNAPAVKKTLTPPVPTPSAPPARTPETPASVAPEGATARCRDGSYSMSQQHRGACSRHGGVESWLQ